MAESEKKTVDDGNSASTVETVFKRLGLAVSTISSVGAVLAALSGDMLSATWLLGVATCCVVIGVAVYAATRPGRRALALVACFSVFGITVAWSFAFRDEIRFSRLFTSFSRAPSVLVEGRISHAVLGPSGAHTTPTLLASFIDDLVSEPHRTRICSPRVCTDGDRLLVVTGDVTDGRFQVELRIPEKQKMAGLFAAPHYLADLIDNIDSPRFLLKNVYDSGENTIRIEAPAETAGPYVRASYHLSRAVSLARQGAAGPALTQKLDEFLVHVRNASSVDPARDWLVEGLLFAARRYEEHEARPRALEALKVGLRLFPGEARLRAAEAYLKLAPAGSGGALVTTSGPADEHALMKVVDAVSEVRRGRLWEASTLLEQAGKLMEQSDKDSSRAFTLHATVAMLASMATGDPGVRGARILSHAKRAEEIQPSVHLLRVLTAFGNTLKGYQSTELFEQLHDDAATPEERSLCDYWRARGHAETRRYDEAKRFLEPLVDRIDEPPATLRPVHAQLIGLLAEVVQGTEAKRARQLALRALEIDDDEVKSHRVLGFNASSDDNPSTDKRRDIREEALRHVDRAIRGGGADSSLYSWRAGLLRDLGKVSEANDSSRRSLEYACKPEGDDVACKVLQTRDLLDASKHDWDKASEYWVQARTQSNTILERFSRREGAAPDPKTIERRIQRNATIAGLAIAWYAHSTELDPDDQMREKAVTNARYIYEDISQDLDRLPPSPWRNSVLGAVRCNLGFVYIDKQLPRLAVSVFEHGLSHLDHADADCQAGLAVALLQVEQTATALQAFRSARKQDPIYDGAQDHMAVLRSVNLWSATACAGLSRLARLDVVATNQLETF